MQYCSGNKTLKFWFFVPTGKERYKQNKTVLEIAEPDDFEFSCWDRSELKKPLKSTLIVKISQVAEMLGNAGCAKLSCTFSHLKRSDWPLVPNPSPLSISSLLPFYLTNFPLRRTSMYCYTLPLYVSLSFRRRFAPSRICILSLAVFGSTSPHCLLIHWKRHANKLCSYNIFVVLCGNWDIVACVLFYSATLHFYEQSFRKVDKKQDFHDYVNIFLWRKLFVQDWPSVIIIHIDQSQTPFAYFYEPTQKNAFWKWCVEYW